MFFFGLNVFEDRLPLRRGEAFPVCHRIMKSVRLEKIPKIIKSSAAQSLRSPLPKATSTSVCEMPRDGDSTTAPGSLSNPCNEEISPKIRSKPPLVKLEAISSDPLSFPRADGRPSLYIPKDSFHSQEEAHGETDQAGLRGDETG